LQEELARVGLQDASAFAVRRLGGREVLAAYTTAFDAHGHSDFYPVVALGGPRARFLHQSATMLPALAQNGMPVLDLLDGRLPLARSRLSDAEIASSLVEYERFAGRIVDALRDAAALDTLRGNWKEEAHEVEELRRLSSAPVQAQDLRAWETNVAALAAFGPGALPPEDLQGSWIEPTWLAPGQPARVAAVMAAYRAAAERDAAAMRANAEAVLKLGKASPLPVQMREQMLSIAMTGAAAQQDLAAVPALATEYGKGLAQDGDAAEVRHFLLAWSRAKH
jgi:hypothetical protein